MPVLIWFIGLARKDKSIWTITCQTENPNLQALFRAKPREECGDGFG